MTYFEALLYGLVQGITEYLPISSSAHLILLPIFLNKPDPGLAFDVFLHVGTLAATLTYFWKDWKTMIQALLSRSSGPTGGMNWKMIAIGTLPALVAGAAFHHAVKTYLRGIDVMIFSLTIGGILLFIIDRFFPQKRGIDSMTYKDALIIGIAQCFALIPGMSRSGMTILTARGLSLDRATAARFSFLLSAPIICAAVVFELKNWRELVESSVGLGPLLVAGVSSFVFGMLAISGLLIVLRRFSYFGFAAYRVLLAIVLWKFFT